jgi:CRP/FNR family cyclic AMP-dependent transcriptional regulator
VSARPPGASPGASPDASPDATAPTRHDLEAALAATPLGRGLSREHVAVLAGCASPHALVAGGFLAHEGGEADTCFVLRSGRVAIEVRAPNETLVVETLGPGDVVGWSWMFPPHRWRFDVEVLADGEAIAIDGKEVRAACERDAALGYAISQRVAQVVIERLGATRLRLLDLYGRTSA